MRLKSRESQAQWQPVGPYSQHVIFLGWQRANGKPNPTRVPWAMATLGRAPRERSRHARGAQAGPLPPPTRYSLPLVGDSATRRCATSGRPRQSNSTTTASLASPASPALLRRKPRFVCLLPARNATFRRAATSPARELVLARRISDLRAVLRVKLRSKRCAVCAPASQVFPL